MDTSLSGALAALSNDLATLVETAGATVVAVEGRDRIGSSGFFLRTDTVVTADHAVESNDVQIVYPDGRTAPARVTGRDPATDVALLTVDSAGPTPLVHAGSSDVHTGAIALAVARDDDGDIEAAMGIVGTVSGAWRTWRGGDMDSFIRADLSLYPRFSGSPLVDAAGRLIGMNTWGLSRRQALVVPAATIRRISDALGSRGRIARGYLGIAMQGIELPAGWGGGSGVIALGVAPDGPAARAGLIVGDIITALAGRRIGDSDDVQSVLDAGSVGTSAAVGLLRGGKPLELNVTIGERPSSDDE